eukprot:1767577-Prymnesium_polylepis.1
MFKGPSMIGMLGDGGMTPNISATDEPDVGLVLGSSADVPALVTSLVSLVDKDRRAELVERSIQDSSVQEFVGTNRVLSKTSAKITAARMILGDALNDNKAVSNALDSLEERVETARESHTADLQKTRETLRPAAIQKIKKIVTEARNVLHDEHGENAPLAPQHCLLAHRAGRSPTALPTRAPTAVPACPQRCPLARSTLPARPWTLPACLQHPRSAARALTALARPQQCPPAHTALPACPERCPLAHSTSGPPTHSTARTPMALPTCPQRCPLAHSTARPPHCPGPVHPQHSPQRSTTHSPKARCPLAQSTLPPRPKHAA